MQPFAQNFEANTNEALKRKINTWFASFDVDCAERGLRYSFTSTFHNPYIDPEKNVVVFSAMFMIEVYEDTDEEEDFDEGE